MEINFGKLNKFMLYWVSTISQKYKIFNLNLDEFGKKTM